MNNTKYLEFDIESIEWAKDILIKYDDKFPKDSDLYKQLETKFNRLLMMLDYTALPEYFREQQIKLARIKVLSTIGDFSWAQLIDENLLVVYSDKRDLVEGILNNFPKLPPYN